MSDNLRPGAFTLGRVFPEAYTRAGHAGDPSLMAAECLLEANADTELSVCVRFRHVVDLRVARVDHGMLAFVDSLTVDGVVHATRQDTIEREVKIARVRVASDAATHCLPFVVDAGTDYETLTTAVGAPAGVVVRSWHKIVGAVDVWTDPIAPGVVKVRVDIANCSAWKREPRDQVFYRTLMSTHAVLRARSGQFISCVNPPASVASMAEGCRSIGAYPVLIGEGPARDAMLCSPASFEDYPGGAAGRGVYVEGENADQLLVRSALLAAQQDQDRAPDLEVRTHVGANWHRGISHNDGMRHQDAAGDGAALHGGAD